MRTDERDFFVNIGVQLKKLRIAAGYNRAENFALAYGLTASSYYKWEQGGHICIRNLIRICDCHEITLQHFFAMITQPLTTKTKVA